MKSPNPLLSSHGGQRAVTRPAGILPGRRRRGRHRARRARTAGPKSSSSTPDRRGLSSAGRRPVREGHQRPAAEPGRRTARVSRAGFHRGSATGNVADAGPLAIASVPGTARSMADRLHRARPPRDVRVDVGARSTDEIVAELGDGSIDLGVVRMADTASAGLKSANSEPSSTRCSRRGLGGYAACGGDGRAGARSLARFARARHIELRNVPAGRGGGTRRLRGRPPPRSRAFTSEDVTRGPVLTASSARARVACATRGRPTSAGPDAAAARRAVAAGAGQARLTSRALVRGI